MPTRRNALTAKPPHASPPNSPAGIPRIYPDLRKGIPMTETATPLWEVFIRARNGLSHKHAGSIHATDAELALQAARDVYTRRGEGQSVWVVRSSDIIASDPVDKDMMFEPTASKIYRHPTFYEIPEDVGNM